VKQQRQSMHPALLNPAGLPGLQGVLAAAIAAAAAGMGGDVGGGGMLPPKAEH
jgi:hypothetical protein